MSSAANLGREILVLRSVLSFDDQTLANISSLQDHFVLNLTSLEKQISLGNICDYLRVQKFSEDPELCLSQTLSVYFTKVSFFFGLQYSLLNTEVFRPVDSTQMLLPSSFSTKTSHGGDLTDPFQVDP